ncbi:DNA gyrase inhibitor YacG [Gynuella sp.]|uniref:DNA gyrase inhibitor YacG n=1 Tax=Gynuella sp. TaxID=2969146 RepID=UPI003D0A8DBC
MIKVKCPTCKKEVEWSKENQFRPFCCERCKLIDLGDWASEGHSIAGPIMMDDPFSEDLDDFFIDPEKNGKDI